MTFNEWLGSQIDEQTEIYEEIGKECYDNGYMQGREDAVDKYADKLLKRLIPNLDKLPSAKDSETYLAIMEIAKELKDQKNE